MAEVTGPISSMPGARHDFPDGTMCDEHPERPAVARVQGETDSFGCEMYDMCAECLREHREEMAKPNVGKCQWCDADNVELRDARDYEEGMSGPVYSVCGPCKTRYDKRLAAEEASYGDYWGD